MSQDYWHGPPIFPAVSTSMVIDFLPVLVTVSCTTWPQRFCWKNSKDGDTIGGCPVVKSSASITTESGGVDLCPWLISISAI